MNHRRRQTAAPETRWSHPRRARLAFLATGLVLTVALRLSAAGAGTQAPEAGLAEVRALEHQGQYDQAVARGRELLKQFPHAAEIRQRLAKDLARNGKCEEAGSLYAAAPASGQAASNRETVIGSCYFYKSDFPAALTHLKRAAQAAPNDKPGALLLARTYASLGRPEEGIRTLEGLRAGRRDDPNVLYWIGAFYDQLAEQTYQGLAKSHPDSYLVLEIQGDQFLQRQKYDDALKSYEKALEAAPNAPGLHFDVGNVYWRMAKLDQATPELEAELKLNPENAQANYELGDIEVKRGEIERGVARLKKALALDATLVEAHRSLGRADLAEREYTEAVREFSVVAQAQPSDHTIHALLASAYQHLGRTQKAQEETRKYNELVKQQMNDLERKEAAQEANPATPAPKN